MFLSECGKKKYELILDRYGFEAKKTKYHAGETVTVYYSMIATDTDYSFYTDSEDVSLTQKYDGKHGYVFTFTMPEHDVRLFVDSRNSMEYIPDTADTVYEQTDTDTVSELGQWKCPECGKCNEGGYCSECGSKKPSDDK